LAEEAKCIAKSSWQRVAGGGVVVAQVESDRVLPLLDQSRFLTSASLLVAEAQVGEELAPLLEAVRGVEWEDYIPNFSRLAVRAERSGSHKFTSLEASRLVGEAIMERLKSKGYSVSVHLNAPSVVVTVDVIGPNAYVGVRLAGEESLHRKWYRVYEHAASLKPPIAHALLELAELRDGEALLDPVCGGGAIPIEASLYHEEVGAICSDISEKAVRGAERNAEAEGVTGKILFLVAPAGDLPQFLERGSVDLVAADPPFGIRLGSVERSRRVVRDIFESSRVLLSSSGRLALLYPSRDFVRELAEELGFEVAHQRRILHGNLWVWISILRA